MRDTFVRTLIELAKQNRNIELVTGDLGFGVLKPFWEQCPNQFTNAGIAEQNMTSMAAGMALSGKTVFTYSIGNFSTLRCLEQIRNDCAYHNANVKIICIGGGFTYGSLGMSHQATEDIAIMRSLPNVAVFAPSDALEAEAVCKAVAEYNGTCYVRLGRGGEKHIHEKLNDFQIGKAIKVRDGKDVAFFVAGAIYDEVDKACELLSAKGIAPTVYTFPTIKPLDEETIKACASSCKLIVTCEEHNIVGGFGSTVAEVMAGIDCSAKLLRVGINDEYAEKVGSQNYLRQQYGLDGNTIAERIEKISNE